MTQNCICPPSPNLIGGLYLEFMVHIIGYEHLCYILQKLQERISAVNKSSIEPRTKEKWRNIMSAEIMSSEESDGDDDVIVLKPLPWRSDKVTRFFYRLDEKSFQAKSTQANVNEGNG